MSDRQYLTAFGPKGDGRNQSLLEAAQALIDEAEFFDDDRGWGYMIGHASMDALKEAVLNLRNDRALRNMRGENE